MSSLLQYGPPEVQGCAHLPAAGWAGESVDTVGLSRMRVRVDSAEWVGGGDHGYLAPVRGTSKGFRGEIGRVWARGAAKRGGSGGR